MRVELVQRARSSRIVPSLFGKEGGRSKTEKIEAELSEQAPESLEKAISSILGDLVERGLGFTELSLSSG